MFATTCFGGAVEACCFLRERAAWVVVLLAAGAEDKPSAVFAADVSGFFFFRGDASGSFALRRLFCDRSLVDPNELSHDFALLPAVRPSGASSRAVGFLFAGAGVFAWNGLSENV